MALRNRCVTIPPQTSGRTDFAISVDLFGRCKPVKNGYTTCCNAFLLCALLAATGAAQAQSTAATAAPADDGLTFHGITLYGTVDLGLQYQTHGAPISDFYPARSADIVQKNSNHSMTGITPSNLSQSRIGLQGLE